MYYKLLPFRFDRFNESEVFLSNEVGEFIFLSNKEFDDFVHYRLANNSETFLNLKAKQIIYDENADPILTMLATKYRTKKSFLQEFTTLHMVVVTLRCNSKCSYCQVSSKDIGNKEFDMDKKTAKNVVDKIFDSPAMNIKIEFQGGEPLLNFKIIKYIIEYSLWKNLFKKRNLQFVICTNLTLMSEKILKFLKNHRVYISTSIDGPKDLHNKNRPLLDTDNSFDQVFEKITLTRKYLGPESVSALMTTTSYSLDSIEKIIDTYVDLGFFEIFIRSLNPYGFAKKEKHKLAYPIDDFIHFYKRGLNYIIDLNLRGIFFIEIFASILLNRILTPFSTGFVDLQSPAGTGICGVIYDYNGNVYVSDEARMLASTGDEKFYMGNVKNNSYQEIFNGGLIHDLIEKSCLESLPQCSSCAYQIYCGTDPVRNYAEQNDIIGHRPTNDISIRNKEIIKFLLTLIKRDDEKINKVFWSWLNRDPGHITETLSP